MSYSNPKSHGHIFRTKQKNRIIKRNVYDPALIGSSFVVVAAMVSSPLLRQPLDVFVPLVRQQFLSQTWLWFNPFGWRKMNLGPLFASPPGICPADNSLFYNLFHDFR
jgi:hypothetical protein